MKDMVTVMLGKRAYRMSREQWQAGLAPIAKEQIPFGIYAVEKNGTIDMLREKCSSITQLKKKARMYKSQGYRVYSNRG